MALASGLTRRVYHHCGPFVERLHLGIEPPPEVGLEKAGAVPGLGRPPKRLIRSMSRELL